MITIRDGRNPGFYQIHNAVLDDHGAAIGPYGIALYNALCRFASYGGTSYPSHKTLGDLVGMGKVSVVKYLKVLQDHGLIKIENRTSEHGDPDSNLYTVLDYVGKGVVHDVNHLVHQVNQGSTPGEPGVVHDVNTNNTHLKNTQLPTPRPPLVEVVDAWRRNMPGTMTPMIEERVSALVEEHGQVDVLRAVEIAVAQNKRSLSYVEGILRKGINDRKPGGTQAAVNGAIVAKGKDIR